MVLPLAALLQPHRRTALLLAAAGKAAGGANKPAQMCRPTAASISPPLAYSCCFHSRVVIATADLQLLAYTRARCQAGLTGRRQPGARVAVGERTVI